MISFRRKHTSKGRRQRMSRCDHITSISISLCGSECTALLLHIPRPTVTLQSPWKMPSCPRLDLVTKSTDIHTAEFSGLY